MSSTSIESSLKPLIVWMRMCGFRIGISKTKSQSIGFVILGAILVLSNIGLHCASFISGVVKLRANEIGRNGTNLTTANLLNIGIEHLNYTCILIGVHAGFYFISLSNNWKELWDSLLMIEEQLNFRPKFYRKCRQCVIIGFFLFSLDVITFVAMSIQSSYWDMGSFRPLTILLSNISRTIVLSVFLLFAVMARVVTLVFQGLNERIALLSQDERHYPFYAAKILNIRLEKWRRNHTMACHLVELLNGSFGLVLLLTITNGFVSFITTSFEIVRSMQDNDTLPLLFAFIFFKKSVILTIMLYEPYRLQAEASRTAVHLRKIQPMVQLFSQIKLNTIVMEVTHASPKITAMDFFDVNLRLLPTLIGSTLTYVAILCQASTSTHSYSN